MIFDVNLEIGFTRKVRLNTDRQQVDTPPYMIYASVISRDSVRIVLILASLNDIYVKCADIQNMYLNEYPKERV